MAQGGRAREIAFYDTGMLVALARGPEDPHYEGAARLDAFARQNKWRVITSPLAIMEAVDVVRKRAAMSHRYRSGSDKEMEAVDDYVRLDGADLLRVITEMIIQGSLDIVDLGVWSPNLAVLMAKMWEHPGHTAPGARGQTYRHRGIGPYDWLLLDFANRAKATIVCTTDAALAGIAGNDAEFGHMRFMLARDPPSSHLSPAAAP